MVAPLPIKHHSLTGRITWSLMVESFRPVARDKGGRWSGQSFCPVVQV
jgi:hypothetical protein